MRLTFGMTELSDKVELVALALGLFGVAEFLRNVNQMDSVGSGMQVKLRDMRPSWAEVKQSFFPMVRGTLIGTLFGAMPGTGSTITTFLAYARVPCKYLYPSALFFIAVGVYSTNNSLFEVGEVLVFGVVGAIFAALDFHVAPI